MLRITRHRAGKAVLFQQCAWCVEVFFDWGAHVGSKRPSWLHLGRLVLDDGKRSMALAIGDWSFSSVS